MRLFLAILAAMLLGFIIGELCRAFFRLQLNRERARKIPQWATDPAYAPPSLGADLPHPYKPFEDLGCCGRCGAGEKHPIHTDPNYVQPAGPAEKGIIGGELPVSFEHHGEK